jgi:drug/metabolite transporter, DME family
MQTSASTSRRGYGLVLIAVSLWATLGIFYTALLQSGFSRVSIAFIRCTIAALILGSSLIVKDRARLKVAWRDLPLLIAFGVIGIAVFYVVQIISVESVGVAVTWVMLYTAPIWVVLFSAIFLHERITQPKMIAIALSLGGCALVVKIYQGAAINLAGLWAGLATGLAYAAYTLFSKAASARGYNTWTFMLYGLFFGAICLLPLQSIDDLTRSIAAPGAMLWLILLCLGPTLAAATIFITGLKYVRASNASIVATIEPVLATLLALIFLHESLEPLQLIGAGLILSAVIVLLRSPDRSDSVVIELAAQ